MPDTKIVLIFLGVAILSNAPEKLPEKKKVERNPEKEKERPIPPNSSIRHRGHNDHINRLVSIHSFYQKI